MLVTHHHAENERDHDLVPKGVTVRLLEPALRRHVHAAWRTHATRRNVITAAVEEFQIAGKAVATSRTRR